MEANHQNIDIRAFEASAKDAANLLSAMSNPTRLMILALLGEAEMSVGELHKWFSLSQSALSQHLARLRKDGLVKTRRSSQTIFYSLEDQHSQTIIATVHDLYCSPQMPGQKLHLAASA